MRKPALNSLTLAIALSGMSLLPTGAQASPGNNMSNQFWWPEIINLSPPERVFTE